MTMYAYESENKHRKILEQMCKSVSSEEERAALEYALLLVQKDLDGETD